MKRSIFIVLAMLTLSIPRASAQNVSINFDFDLYPDYYNSYEDDIYRYGFNINNYAALYEDRFIDQIRHDYGISRSVIRRYLRRGFSPSDILFGAELSYRTGHRFQYIMDGYYNSPSRNWSSISVNLGIPIGSARFNLILGSFNRYYVDWGNYYHVHCPNFRPPMYNNSWSYFRPSPTPHRPPQYHHRPNHNRPNQPPSHGQSSGGRQPSGTLPGYENNSGNRPGQGAQPSQPNRPGQSTQPSQPNRPGQEATPSQPVRRPSGNSSGSNSGSTNSDRRGQGVNPSQRPSNNNSGNNSSSGSRREQPATAPSTNNSRNESNSSSRNSSSSSNSGNSSSSSSSRRSGSNSSSSSSSANSSSSRSSNSSSRSESRSSNSSSRSSNESGNSGSSSSSSSRRGR